MSVDQPPTPRTAAELRRYGPTLADAALRVQAESVTAGLAAQRDGWRRGFTRRRFVAGAGAVGVAALGAQLATARVAFGNPNTTGRSLVVVFLRGGMDGLSVVVPAADPNLAKARPTIGVPAAALLPGDRRFGLHPELKPLHELWTKGQFAAVHAVASPDASRSHFQAQDCIERGAASTAVHTGWLDRLLEKLGPGTTFRAISGSSELPRSLVGGESKVVVQSVGDFRLGGGDGVRAASMEALRKLYTGVNHPLALQAQITLQAMTAAQRIGNTPPAAGVTYPGGHFADRLRDVARLLKSGAGLRVATVDVGGWDMHTNLGKVDGGEMRNHVKDVAEALAAFTADLGPLLANTNVVLMSEFGRRVAENGNAGTDHGHGGLMLLLGGGLNGGRVHGAWPGLAPSALDHGDVAGANDYRDVLAELLNRRFGVADLAAVFPGHTAKRLGVCV